MHLFPVILSLICFCVLSSPALAWSTSAHQDIARETLKLLSKQERRYYKKLAEAMPVRGLSFEDLSPWVDSIRGEPVLEVFGGKVPRALRSLQNRHSSNWHYENTFYFKPRQKYRCDLTNNGRLKQALLAIDRALKSKVDKKREAILVAFAMHLIEDAHQPLHTGTLVRSDCSLDLGGNRYCLQKFSGKCALNLHQLWDRAFSASRNSSLAKRVSRDFTTPFSIEIEIEKILEEGQSALPTVYSIEENRAPFEGYIDRGKQVAEDRLINTVGRLTHFLKMHYARKS